MMHQGLDQEAWDRGALDQEALDQEAWDRGAWDQEAWDRGAWDRGAWDQEALDRGALDRGAWDQEAWDQGALDRGALVQEALDRVALDQGAWDRGLVEEQRHSLQVVTQLGQNSHTWLGIMPVMFHRISFLCTLCTKIACPLVCCIHPNLSCSCNTFWRSPRPSIFH